MAGSILGNAVVRVEDPELLLGRGRYVENLPIDGLTHAAFVRSTVAHGEIEHIDLTAAAAMPGVLALYVGEDLADIAPFATFGFLLHPATGRTPLARGKVCYVGDPVAIVVAETKAQAVDAAEAVVVDYRPLPAVVDMEAALAPGAPVQNETLGTNLVASRAADGGVDPLAGADVVVRVRMENQRMAVVPMESDAIAAIPPAGGEPWTVYVATQMPHAFHRLASATMGFGDGQLRVITPHVGGGFGGKVGIAPEHIAVLCAARRLGRPVRWVETRSESMAALPHGRAQVQYVELGLKSDGAFVGMRCRLVGDAGAYGGFGGNMVLGPTRMMAQGVYRLPALHYDAAVALTNTTPTGALRGAGRPEAAAMLERLVDLAADELGMDPAELRRRNLLQPHEFPFTTATGVRYDCGGYPAALDEALRLAGYDVLLAEQAARRASGDRVQLGIGMSAYVEITAGGSTSEFGAVEVHPDGTATVRAGTSAHGQGHATAFAMIVADRLGLPIEAVRLVQSDTALVPRGGGTGGSRSLQLGGTAVAAAADEVWAQARRLAAHLLEADPADIVVGDDGRVGVAGVPASALTWAQLAVAAADAGEPLAAQLDVDQGAPSFPFGAHVAVVEVDTETGRVVPLRHIAVDDCGRRLNPLLVEGQQHGGIAQGIAQVLWEQVVYDEEGNLLTSTLAEYGVPSAAELCSFEAHGTETPTPLNALGAKGIGESGTIGATPAVHNAIIDAVSHLGVRHIDLPCTPERVWRAVERARGGAPDPLWREPPAVFSALPRRASSPTVDVDV